jgi:predicted PolB exonuclease-like 3'-5' exonuclease
MRCGGYGFVSTQEVLGPPIGEFCPGCEDCEMGPLIVDIECVGIDTASDFLEPIEAPSNYKDEAKKAEYIAAATAKAVERCGLDPDLCRIVALGHGEADGKDHVILCRDEETEAAALDALAKHITNSAGITRTLVSFNGFGYDLPVLMRRAQYLGVQFPLLNIDKYRSPHIDLMQKLSFNGAIKPHSLKFYASRFGMPVEDNIDGSQIAALVQAGDWAGVESHCRSDLALTRFLAQKLKLIPRAETVAA